MPVDEIPEEPPEGFVYITHSEIENKGPGPEGSWGPIALHSFETIHQHKGWQVWDAPAQAAEASKSTSDDEGDSDKSKTSARKSSSKEK